MDSTLFKFHTVSECACCGLVIAVPNSERTVTMGDGSSFRTAGPISEAYRDHLESAPMCKAWHDTLPRFSDLRGILDS